MKHIRLQCPICHAHKSYPVADSYLEMPMNAGGLRFFVVATETVCSHTFVIIVDQHFAVRGALDYGLGKLDFDPVDPPITLPIPWC